MERVIRPLVIRKPIFPVDIFAVCLKQREWQCRRAYLTQLVDPSPIGLYHFQIFRIHPYQSVQICMGAIQHLRLHFENVAVDLVHLFFADIFQVVFRKLAAGQRKCGNAIQLFHVLSFQVEIMQRRLRLLHHFADHLPIRCPHRLRHHQELPRRLAIVPKLIDANRLAVSIIRARRNKFIFLPRKSPNDLIRRQRRRRRGLRLRPQPPHIMLFRRCRRKRPLRILRASP